MKIRYVGGSTLPQYIPAADVEAEPGEEVEVPDLVALSIVQQDTWEPVGWTPPTNVKPPTIAEILADVGDDPDLAAAALEVEQAADSPRSSLVEKLELIAAKKEND